MRIGDRNGWSAAGVDGQNRLGKIDVVSTRQKFIVLEHFVMLCIAIRCSEGGGRGEVGGEGGALNDFQYCFERVSG